MERKKRKTPCNRWKRNIRRTKIKENMAKSREKREESAISRTQHKKRNSGNNRTHHEQQEEAIKRTYQHITSQTRVCDQLSTTQKRDSAISRAQRENKTHVHIVYEAHQKVADRDFPLGDLHKEILPSIMHIPHDKHVEIYVCMNLDRSVLCAIPLV